jgi:hypothetical protein
MQGFCETRNKRQSKVMRKDTGTTARGKQRIAQMTSVGTGSANVRLSASSYAKKNEAT